MEMIQEWEADNTQERTASQQVGSAAEADCSPCEENLEHLKKAQQRWERERKTTAVAMSGTDDAP